MGSLAEHCRFSVVPYQYYTKTGSGHTPSRSVEEYWEDCSVPWVTTADVKHLRDGRLQVLQDTEFHINEQGLANSAARLHPSGTVVLSRTASVGFAAIMGQPMATSQDFFTWTPMSDLDSRYLLWVLRAMRSNGDFDRLMYGSTHKTIYVPDLQRLRGPLPSVEEQRRIADYLDAETARLDALTRENRKAAGLAQDRFRALRRELLVGSRLLGDPAAVADLESRPGWAVPRLWMVSRNHDGKRIPLNGEERATRSGPYPYWGANTIVDHIDDYLFEGPHVLIGEDGAPFFDEERDVAWVAAGRFWVNNHAHVLEAVNVEPEWLAECLNVVDYSQYVVGSTRDKLTQGALSRIPIPVAPRLERTRILRQLQEGRAVASRLQDAVGRNILLLRERRGALITAAVTGELVV